MAKGAIAKQQVFDKLMEVFPTTMMDDKVLRIALVEDGVPVEIKVALTCAKDCIIGAAAEPNASVASQPTTEPVLAQPTEQEIENVQNLLAKLGMKKEG